MPGAYVYTDYGGPEVQRLVDLPKPVPGLGQLLVAVRAAGVNPADWKFRSGLRREVEHLAQPVAFGLEAAGVVEAVGEGADRFAIGDEVFGSVVGGAGFGEYALLSADVAARKPAAVSFVDAATLPVAGATAYDGVHQLGLTPGQTLLITGAGGGVGIAAVQIAMDLGLKVIGTASEPKKALVEAFGARHVPYGPGVADRIRLNAPDGVDAIYDLVGGDALRDVADLVADKSRMITGADVATATELGGGPVTRARNTAVLEALAALVERGALRPSVTGVFPLDRAGDALALVETGHATGKVVIKVS